LCLFLLGFISVFRLLRWCFKVEMELEIPVMFLG
jgi:hypothetical protein